MEHPATNTAVLPGPENRSALPAGASKPLAGTPRPARGHHEDLQ
jgi:hypothetical protein